MADPDLEIPQRQTYPTIRGSASDQAGVIDFTSADDVELLVDDGAAGLFSLPVDPIDPADDVTFLDENGIVKVANWEASIGAGMSDDVTSFQGKLKVTWDSGASPPLVQYIPKHGFMNISITENVRES